MSKPVALVSSIVVGLQIAYMAGRSSMDPLARSVTAAFASWVAGMAIGLLAWLLFASSAKATDVQFTVDPVPLGTHGLMVLVGAGGLHLMLTTVSPDMRDLIVGNPPLLFGAAGGVVGILTTPLPPYKGAK